VALRTAGRKEEALVQAHRSNDLLRETWGEPEKLAQLSAVDQICLNRLCTFIDRLIGTLTSAK